MERTVLEHFEVAEAVEISETIFDCFLFEEGRGHSGRGRKLETDCEIK
jgi:hypothetical protein